MNTIRTSLWPGERVNFSVEQRGRFRRRPVQAESCLSLLVLESNDSDEPKLYEPVFKLIYIVIHMLFRSYQSFKTKRNIGDFAETR